MGRILLPDNIATVVRNSGTQLQMASTRDGQPVRITVGGQQYKLSSTMTLNTGTSGFGGLLDTFVVSSIWNVFAVVSNGVLGMVGTTSSSPTGYSSYKFLGKFIATSGSPTISHFMNVGEAFKEYVYNSGTWDSTDTTNFAHGAVGGAITGSLGANRNKIVRFLVAPILLTDRYALELSVNGDSNHFYDLGNAGEGTATAYVIQNGVEYGVQFDTFIGNELTLKFLIYRRPSGATYGSAGTAWTNGMRWRVCKISDVITGP